MHSGDAARIPSWGHNGAPSHLPLPPVHTDSAILLAHFQPSEQMWGKSLTLLWMLLTTSQLDRVLSGFSVLLGSLGMSAFASWLFPPALGAKLSFLVYRTSIILVWLCIVNKPFLLPLIYGLLQLHFRLPALWHRPGAFASCHPDEGATCQRITTNYVPPAK